MNRCQFVEDHQRRFGVKRLCDILGISRSSFYYWRRTAVARAARQTVEDGLAARIRKVHQDSDGTYGAPRITAELRDEGGQVVNHKRVARIMRTIGLQGVRLRRRHRTTVGDQASPKAPDLIGRDFTAAAVNTKYVGDITYLPVSGAKPLYLATVIDLASRRLAGWAIADHMRTELVIDALAAAERTRGSLAGAVLRRPIESGPSPRARMGHASVGFDVVETCGRVGDAELKHWLPTCQALHVCKRIQRCSSSSDSMRRIPSWVRVTIAGVLPGSQSTVIRPSPAR